MEAEIFIRCWDGARRRRGYRRCDAAVLLLRKRREEAVCVCVWLGGLVGVFDSDPAAVCRREAAAVWAMRR